MLRYFVFNKPHPDPLLEEREKYYRKPLNPLKGTFASIQTLSPFRGLG